MGFENCKLFWTNPHIVGKQVRIHGTSVVFEAVLADGGSAGAREQLRRAEEGGAGRDQRPLRHEEPGGEALRRPARGRARGTTQGIHSCEDL